MAYKCVYDTVHQLIRQLAVGYVARGYWFYVTGWIPEGKDPAKVDAKLIAKYGIDVSPWVRARRKKRGEASVHYLRHGRWFALLGTRGRHRFFGEEAFADIRRKPLVYGGYAVKYAMLKPDGGVASVRISECQLRNVRQSIELLRVTMSTNELMASIDLLPFVRFAPVRRQIDGLKRLLCTID